MRGSNGVEVEFGMHPNLNDMTSGEYYDLDNYINDFSTMHKAMAILFRPIVKHYKDLYDIEEYNGTDKYEEHMKYMPADVAIGARLFFYRLRMKLSKHTILNLHTCLTWLAFEREKNELEAKRIKDAYKRWQQSMT